MKLLYAAALILALCPEAHAGRVVMFFGDSRFNTGSSSNIPTLVDDARADFVVCNKSVNGRTTVGGLADIDAALVQCAAMGDLTDVIVMLSINDLIFVGGTTYAAAVRLLDIASHVTAFGPRAWIVAEIPGPITTWGSLNGRIWTRDILSYVRGAWFPRIIEVRDKLLEKGWYTSACSNDELHPTVLACRQFIAAEPIAVIP